METRLGVQAFACLTLYHMSFSDKRRETQTLNSVCKPPVYIKQNNK